MIVEGARNKASRRVSIFSGLHVANLRVMVASNLWKFLGRGLDTRRWQQHSGGVSAVRLQTLRKKRAERKGVFERRNGRGDLEVRNSLPGGSGNGSREEQEEISRKGYRTFFFLLLDSWEGEEGTCNSQQVRFLGRDVCIIVEGQNHLL